MLPLVGSPRTHVLDTRRGAHITNVRLVSGDETVCTVTPLMRRGACIPEVPHLGAEHADQPGGARIIDVVRSIRPTLPTVETYRSQLRSPLLLLPRLRSGCACMT
jgi:hypothetical protein